MNTEKLSDKALTVLRKAGWNLSRTIETKQWIMPLQHEGFNVFHLAQEVLQEFGGLRITPPEEHVGTFSPLPFDFEPFEAASGEYDRMEIFEEKATEQLFPLGTAFDHMMLLIGRSGKIYLGHISEVYIIGKSLEEALENLILARENPIAL